MAVCVLAGQEYSLHSRLKTKPANFAYVLSKTIDGKTEDNMLNFMAVIKFNKCTFDEWKKEMEEDTEMDGLFMKDVMIAKVDDNTAIMCADVFDRELQKTMLSDPSFLEIHEQMGIEFTEYELQPAPVP